MPYLLTVQKLIRLSACRVYISICTGLTLFVF
nr:MAG TPA: hypothetical protein [Caudoviricetes sp.]